MNTDDLESALKFLRARIDVALIELQEGETDRVADELDRAVERLQDLLQELRS